MIAETVPTWLQPAPENPLEVFKQLGWFLVPLPEKSKAPANAGWNLIVNCSVPDNWRGNVGLALAYSRMVSIDVDHWLKASRWLSQQGIGLDQFYKDPQAVVLESGKEGHGKIFYRLPDGIQPLPTQQIKIDGECILEFRCATQDRKTVQDVIHGIHPETGKAYRWRIPEGFDLLTYLQQMKPLPDALLQLWQSRLSADEPKQLERNDANISWKEIEAALECISPDCSRDEWIKVGMALHWAGSVDDKNDTALNAWDVWSKKSLEKYPSIREMQKQWNSFKVDKSSSVTLGTLFQIAREYGYQKTFDVQDLFKATSERNFDQAKSASGGQQDRVVLLDASDIAPRPIRWIWSGWLAAGKLHILAGAPGTGKSTLAFALASSISTAGRWPDGTPADLGEVAIWSGEDDQSDTIIPRLLACGANLKNIKIISGMTGKDPRPFDPATDMAALSAALHGHNLRLLIVDPVVSAVAGDSHKNTEVRRALQPLVDLAVSIDCAVLGISHFTKSSAGKDPIDRVTGSLAFGAVARVVMAAAKLPEDEHNGARLLARAKSNIGPDDGGVLYHLEQIAIPDHLEITNTRIIWGKLVEGSARDLLAQAERNDGEEKSATDEAREWLEDLLASGAMKAGAVSSEARQAGITEKALRRAREKLGIKPKKKDFGGGWFWELPTDYQKAKLPPFIEDAPKMPNKK